MESFEKQFQNATDFANHLKDIVNKAKKPAMFFNEPQDSDDYDVMVNGRFKSYLKQYMQKSGKNFDDDYFDDSFESLFDGNSISDLLSMEILSTMFTFRGIVFSYCETLFDNNDFSNLETVHKDVESKGFLFSGNKDLDEEKAIDHTAKLEIVRYCYKNEFYFIVNCDFKQGFYDIAPEKIVFDNDSTDFIMNDVVPTTLIHIDSKTVLTYNSAMETLVNDYYSSTDDTKTQVGKLCYDLIRLENKDTKSEVLQEFIDVQQNTSRTLEFVSSFNIKNIFGSLILSYVTIENREYFKLSLNIKKSSMQDVLPILSQENYSKEELLNSINERNKFNFVYNITTDELVISSRTQNDIDSIIALFPEFSVEDILNNLKIYSSNFAKTQCVDTSTKEFDITLNKINLYLQNKNSKYYYHPIYGGEINLFASYNHYFDTSNNNDYLFVECFSGDDIPQPTTHLDNVDSSFDVLLSHDKPAFIVDIDNLKIISTNSLMEDLVVQEQSNLGATTVVKTSIYSREQILQKWLFDSTTPVKIDNCTKLHYAYQNLLNLTELNTTISYMVAPNNGSRLVLENGETLNYIDDLNNLDKDGVTIYDRTLGCGFLQTPYVTVNKINVENKNYASLEYEILPLFATQYTKKKFISNKTKQLSKYLEVDELSSLIRNMFVDNYLNLYKFLKEIKNLIEDFEKHTHAFGESSLDLYNLLIENTNKYRQCHNEISKLRKKRKKENDILKIYHEFTPHITQQIELVQNSIESVSTFLEEDFCGVTREFIEESLEPDSGFSVAPDLVALSELEEPMLDCTTQLGDTLKQQLDTLEMNKVLANVLRQPDSPSLIADARVGTIYTYNSRLAERFDKYDEYLKNNPAQTRYHVVGLDTKGYRFYERVREFFSPENYNPIQNWDMQTCISYEINDFEINDDNQKYISNCFNQSIKVDIIPIKIDNETFALCFYTPLIPENLPKQNYTKQQGMQLWNDLLNCEIDLFDMNAALKLLKDYYQASAVIPLGLFHDFGHLSYSLNGMHDDSNREQNSEFDGLNFFKSHQHLIDKVAYKLDDKYKTAEFFETGVKFIDLKDSQTLKEIKQELNGKSNSIRVSELGKIIYASQVYSPDAQVRSLGVCVCSDKNVDLSNIILLINPIKHLTKENDQLELLHSITRAIMLHECWHGYGHGLIPREVNDVLTEYWSILREDVTSECTRLSHEYGAEYKQISKEPLTSLMPYLKSKKLNKIGLILTSLAQTYVIPNDLLPKGKGYSEVRRYTATPGVIVCFNWSHDEFDALLKQLEIEKPEDEYIGSAWDSGHYSIEQLLKDAKLLQFIKSQSSYTKDKWEQSDNTHLSKLLYDLKQNEYHVELQAQVSLKEGDNWKCHGAEALIRRTDKSTFPDEFVPFFEEHGIVRHIDFFVLETICQTLQKWNKMHRNNLVDISFSVNLSRVTLMEPGIVQSIVEICDKYEIPHSQVIMEVTERVGLIKSDVSKKLIQEFKDNGYKVSLDDFGSDSSNLSALAKISVDEVKVDKGLVDYIADHTDDEDASKNTTKDDKIYSMVKNVISMCNKFDHDTITLAEGIENITQAETLRGFNCSIGQGYHFSKPISLDDFYDKYVKDR